jgi:hypothetical protein
MTTPNPGSDVALEAGCTCFVLDNARGKGNSRGEFWYTVGCPVHYLGHTDLMVSPESLDAWLDANPPEEMA